MPHTNPRNAIVYLIILLTCVLLYPPWRFGRDYMGRHFSHPGPHAFIGSPPESPTLGYKAELDPIKLFLIYSITAVLAGGTLFGLNRIQKKRQKSKPIHPPATADKKSALNHATD